MTIDQTQFSKDHDKDVGHDIILGLFLAFTCIQPKREADSGAAAPAGVRPRWWYNAVTGTCEQFMWDPWDETEMQSPNNFKTREHCESFCRDSMIFMLI